MTPDQPRTLSTVTNDLRTRGYKNSFRVDGDRLICLETRVSYAANDLKIAEYHRFEGESDPADMSIVFAVECEDGNKGVVVSAYGTYADNGTLDFMKNVRIPDHPQAGGILR